MRKTIQFVSCLVLLLFCCCAFATQLDNDCDGIFYPDPPDVLGPTITGTRILNQSGITIDVTVSMADNDCDSVSPGFEMVDTTMLKIICDPALGRKIARVRKAYDAAQIRASGKREEELRLMRREARRTGRIWRPCSRVLRNLGIRAKKRLGSATFVLGDYGVDTVNNYVWAVMPVEGEYAVGIPEPLSLAIMTTGGVLLAVRRKK